MEKQPSIVAILGTGVWGSALGVLVSKNQHQVRFWSRSSGTSLVEAIAQSEVIVSAVSMKGVQPTIDRLKQITLRSQTVIVTATKGLDPTTTNTPSIEAILHSLKGTAEGINTTKVLIKIARQRKIIVPIAERVNLLLQQKITPPQAVKALMARELKAESN